MKNYSFFKFLILFIYIFQFYSCSKIHEENDLNVNTLDSNIEKLASENFKYEMSRLVQLELKVEWNKALLPHKVVEVLVGHNANKTKKVLKLISNKEGIVKVNLNLPSVYNHFYLRYTYLGTIYFKKIVLAEYNLSTSNILEDILNMFIKKVHALGPCIESVTPWLDKYSFVASEYDTNGVPSNIIRGEEDLSSDFLERVDISLPERKPVPEFHPEFISDGTYSNIHLIQDADVWITYIAEGAGYKNTLGYFSYPTNTPPEDIYEVEDLKIIYPNVSNQYSGGDLRPGDKVYLGSFAAGTTISYFLTANGWNNSSKCVRYHDVHWNYNVYSVTGFNPEPTSAKRRHNVLFYDDYEDRLVIGFEDLIRNSGSDEDFNDALFYMISNPISAIDKENIEPIDETLDSDNDGVDDEYDDYPNDDSKAFNNYYPAENIYGTLLFEDLWPTLGDYDFNDLVVYYNYIYITNASGDISQILVSYKIAATGAGQTNGFALQLPIDPMLISSISGQEIFGDGISLNNNGTETGQDKTVIIVTDNVNKNLPYFSNVYGSMNRDTHDINLIINFAESVNIGSIGLPPYDPFLIKNQNRKDEIHQINYGPTTLGTSRLFGKFDDTTVASNNIYYRTTNYLPWVINIPSKIPHPKERIPLFNAYSHFAVWASSNGTYFQDWYEDKENYRSDNKLVSE
jgi:LruC domain-containing protein